MGRQPHARGLRLGDIPPGTCKLGRVTGKEVAIFNVDGKLYATQNDCTHAGGPLCEGSLWGETVTCPWHGSEFDVRTGEVIAGPARSPLQTYRVDVQDEVIVLRTED
jgi:nitrite reductase/ring-hydroxylating ferredoxin subunit